MKLIITPISVKGKKLQIPTDKIKYYVPLREGCEIELYGRRKIFVKNRYSISSFGLPSIRRLQEGKHW